MHPSDSISHFDSPKDRTKCWSNSPAPQLSNQTAPRQLLLHNWLRSTKWCGWSDVNPPWPGTGPSAPPGFHCTRKSMTLATPNSSRHRPRVVAPNASLSSHLCMKGVALHQIEDNFWLDHSWKCRHHPWQLRNMIWIPWWSTQNEPSHLPLRTLRTNQHGAPKRPHREPQRKVELFGKTNHHWSRKAWDVHWVARLLSLLKVVDRWAQHSRSSKAYPWRRVVPDHSKIHCICRARHVRPPQKLDIG